MEAEGAYGRHNFADCGFGVSICWYKGMEARTSIRFQRDELILRKIALVGIVLSFCLVARSRRVYNSRALRVALISLAVIISERGHQQLQMNLCILLDMGIS